MPETKGKTVVISFRVPAEIAEVLDMIAGDLQPIEPYSQATRASVAKRCFELGIEPMLADLDDRGVKIVWPETVH